MEYNFRVILRYSTTSAIRNVSCSRTCEAQFPLLPNVNQYYVAYVWAINSQGEAVGTPSSSNISKFTSGNTLK